VESWAGVGLWSAEWLVKWVDILLVSSTARDWCWKLLVAFVGGRSLSVDILWPRLSGPLLTLRVLGPWGMRRCCHTARDVWHSHLRGRNVVCQLVVNLGMLMVVLLRSCGY
jgi:hypothetical protein